MSDALIQQVLTAWDEHFNESPILVQSPGRINLIGEHTDYNEGYVFPAAIDKYIVSAMLDVEGSDVCQIIALDKGESLRFSLNEQTVFPKGSWENYVYGVVCELQNAGYELGGFNMIFAGDIPIGAGLSSSAALENATVFGLSLLFGLQMSKDDMILIAQKAEQNYAGVQCGIMDQYASMFGVADHGLLLDCRSLKSLEKPLDLGLYELVLVNSNVKHSLADSAYNVRREECQTGVEILQAIYPDLHALRDINIHQLEEVTEHFPPVIYDRCAYVVKENQRVLQAVIALEEGDVYTLGALLNAAHYDMRYLYEITCAEIDYLVDMVADHEDLLGSRMMGGGFGGCTINLIKIGTANEIFDDELKANYHQRFNKQLSVMPVEIGDGTALIDGM